MMRIRQLPRPWHVVHVIGRLGTGGAERQLINYLRSADREKFRHTVMCLVARGELADQVVAVGIPVVPLRARARYAPVSLLRIVRWLKRENVAVVHTHMHHAALWGRLAGVLAGVPVLVTTEHGKELWKNSLQVAIDRSLSRRTNRHIAVSQDGLEIRLRRERVAADRIVLIPNGVPIPADPVNESGRQRIRSEFGLAPQTRLLGTVGRLIEAKGYEHLLGAMQILHREFPDLRWLAVGDGTQRASLIAMAATMGLSDTVIWAGTRTDVGDLLAAMDLWVMSSVREGLPMALLEAMAAQKPIVATQVGGIPDAVRDGHEAVLVAPGDPEVLARAISRMLRESRRAEALASAARQRAITEYSIDRVARRIEDVYLQELRKLNEEVD